MNDHARGPSTSNPTDSQEAAMSTPPPADPLVSHRRPLTMTVEEAAALIGISRSSAYDAVHRGDIPARRIGHRILVLTEPLYELFAPAPDTATELPDDAST